MRPTGESPRELTYDTVVKQLDTKRYFARYPPVLDENNTVKIRNLQCFREVLPPGAMEIDDVFDRNREPKTQGAGLISSSGMPF